MCLSNHINLDKRIVADLRYGTSHRAFIVMVNSVIAKVADGLDMSDFADTVFTVDAWEDGESPVDVAEQILQNDTIGEQFLDLYLNPEGDPR